MSSRFHNKFHKHNHHSTPSIDPRYPDSANDPIASTDSPFQGDFILHGGLSASVSPSASHILNGNLIAGCNNNTNSLTGVYILGNGIGASQKDYTYVNNLNSSGIVNALGGSSTEWNSTNTVVGSMSAIWGYHNTIDNLTISNISVVGDNTITVVPITGVSIVPSDPHNYIVSIDGLTQVPLTNYYLSSVNLSAYLILTSPLSTGQIANITIISGNIINAYTYIAGTSSIRPVSGNNVAGGYWSNISGGYNNNTFADYSFIAGGSNNNTNSYANTFLLGSNLNASEINYTYVNNLSSQGLIYDANGVSSDWNNTKTAVNTNSASWIGGNSAFTYVNANSATNNYTYNSANFVKLSSEPFTLIEATNSIQPINGNNTITSGCYANIAGGCCNATIGWYSTVAGGLCNTASGYYSNVPGGSLNNASGRFSNIGGGSCNCSCGNFSNVGGGACNNTCGQYSNIAGGSNNTVSANFANIAGGWCNIASGCKSYIAGGQCNISSGLYSSIVGGYKNTTSGCYSNIIGGKTNIASGQSSFIASGSANNTLGFQNSFILGSNLSASQANYTYVNNLSSQGVLHGKQLNIGNAVAATSGISGLINKIEIFNSSGVSLGFIPIYSTIV